MLGYLYLIYNDRNGTILYIYMILDAVINSVVLCHQYTEVSVTGWHSQSPRDGLGGCLHFLPLTDAAPMNVPA